MEKLSKQDTGKSGSGTTRENYSADEIAQEGSYHDSTEVAQQMRAGNNAKNDAAQPNNDPEGGRGVKGSPASGKKQR